MFLAAPFMTSTVTGLTAVSYQAYDRATFPDISEIPSCQAGDILLQVEVGNTLTLATTPTGWTDVTSNTNDGYLFAVAAKVADGTETGDQPNLTADTTPSLSYSVVYRPNIPVTSITVSDTNASFTHGNPGAQVKNVTGSDLPCMVVAVYDNSSSSSTRTFSGGEDYELYTGSAGRYVRHKFFETGSADEDVTVDTNDTGSYNGLISAILRITV